MASRSLLLLGLLLACSCLVQAGRSYTFQPAKYVRDDWAKCKTYVPAPKYDKCDKDYDWNKKNQIVACLLSKKCFKQHESYCCDHKSGEEYKHTCFAECFGVHTTTPGRCSKPQVHRPQPQPQPVKVVVYHPQPHPKPVQQEENHHKPKPMPQPHPVKNTPHPVKHDGDKPNEDKPHGGDKPKPMPQPQPVKNTPHPRPGDKHDDKPQNNGGKHDYSNGMGSKGKDRPSYNNDGKGNKGGEDNNKGGKGNKRED